MTTQSTPFPASTDANPTTPICQHGVRLSLDDKPHCFECEKVATIYGLPRSARMMDYPNALAFTALLKAAGTETDTAGTVYTRPQATDAAPAPAPTDDRTQEWVDACPCPRCSLRRRIEAAVRGASRPYSGEKAAEDIFPPRSTRGLDALMSDLKMDRTTGMPADDVKLTGGQRMLERVVVQLRGELSEVTADRDSFAAENMELLGKLGTADDAIEALTESEEVASATVAELQKKLDIANQQHEAQKSNYAQMLKMYNDVTGSSTMADVLRDRAHLARQCEQHSQTILRVQAERDEALRKVQSVIETVTRFG